MFRDRRKGIRRIFQIAEFETEKNEARANIIYRWSQEEDDLVRHSESTRFFEDISRHTGMNQEELERNLTEKKEILSWLLKSNIRSLKDFGKVMNFFYKNKALLLEHMKKNDINGLLSIQHGL
jgi:hypothetical protein